MTWPFPATSQICVPHCLTSICNIFLKAAKDGYFVSHVICWWDDCMGKGIYQYSALLCSKVEVWGREFLIGKNDAAILEP